MNKKVFCLFLFGLVVIGALLIRRNANSIISDAGNTADPSDAAADLSGEFLREIDGIPVYLDRQMLHPASVGWRKELRQKAEYVSWDEAFIIQSDIPASDIEIKKVLLTDSGFELTEYADASFENNVFYHQPWGDLWILGGNTTLWIGYRIIVESSGRLEYRFVVKSPLPSIEVASLAASLEESFAAQKIIRSLSVRGDTDGDGTAEDIALHLSEDNIPFLTVNDQIQLCFFKSDHSYYTAAEIAAADIDDDSRDEIIVFWNSPLLLGFGVQLVDYQGGRWVEKEFPEASATASLSQNTVILSFPDGNSCHVALSEDESLQYSIAPYFDSDGNPYSKDVAVTCYPEWYHCLEETSTGAKLRIGVTVNLCAAAQIEDEFIPCYDSTLCMIPLQVCLNDGELCYVYESPLFHYDLGPC